MIITAHERELVLALRELKEAAFYNERPPETREEWFEEHRTRHWLEHLCDVLGHAEPDRPSTVEELVQLMIDIDAGNLESYRRDHDSVILFCTDAPDRAPWQAVREAPGAPEARARHRALWMREHERWRHKR